MALVTPALRRSPAHGARVVLSDIDQELTQEAAEKIKAADGEAFAAPGDVTDSAFATRLIKAALDRFGRIDSIVNNAGYTWDGTIHKMSDEQWQAMLDVHLTAPFRIIRAASEYLRETAKREKEQHGRAAARKIVNVSSTTGTRGNAGQSTTRRASRNHWRNQNVAKEWGRSTSG